MEELILVGGEFHCGVAGKSMVRSTQRVVPFEPSSSWLFGRARLRKQRFFFFEINSSGCVEYNGVTLCGAGHLPASQNVYNG